MATSSPILSFRDAKNPGSVVGSINYVQSTLGTDFLPVLQGEQSIPVKVRVYNNYGLATGIASAFNVYVTAYDGVGSASHTSVKSIINQAWIRVYETGFGEGSVGNGLYTAWCGSDTAIGGTDVYFAEVGSDGGYTGQIRAGSDTNGVGFIEFETYVEVPEGADFSEWYVAFSLSYEWVS